jgi:hypothetical protein
MCVCVCMHVYACGVNENVSPCLYAAADAHGAMGCDHKALSYSFICGDDASSCPNPYPTYACPTFHLI